jgi:hypothetical protein
VKQGMVKRMMKCVMGIGVMALLVVTLEPLAKARSIGAFAGNPLDGSSWSCFAESAGAVTGTGAAGCVGTPFAGSPRWETQLPVENTGSYTVTFGIRGNGSTGPTCLAYGVSQLSAIVVTSLSATNATTSFVPKAVAVSSVPGGGYLFGACDTLTNSSFRVGSINWTQP